MYLISPTTNNKALIYFINDTEKTEAVARKHLPSLARYVFLEDEEFVEKNYQSLFSEAYEFHEIDGLIVNFSKAKEIWLNFYRKHRESLLKDLDVDYIRADEQEDKELKKEIASKKQALRDVTKTELPNSLEEIKATWPEILGQNPFK